MPTTPMVREGERMHQEDVLSREGRIGIRDGVALSWELGSRGGMRAGIKIERGRGRKRGAEFGLETIRETWTH